jgi:hypothetical protein
MKYTVPTPIKFNGERFEVDAPIELNDEQAKPLLDSGSITSEEGREVAAHAAPGAESVARRPVVADPEGSEKMYSKS